MIHLKRCIDFSEYKYPGVNAVLEREIERIYRFYAYERASPNLIMQIRTTVQQRVRRLRLTDPNFRDLPSPFILEINGESFEIY